tara:strand:+ start:305 stop:529 length:225 start_codon:yes stop_codon:yes gene_type:complete
MKVGDLVKSNEEYNSGDSSVEGYQPIGFIISIHPTRSSRRTVQWVFPLVFKETFINTYDLTLLSASPHPEHESR